MIKKLKKVIEKIVLKIREKNKYQTLSPKLNLKNSNENIIILGEVLKNKNNKNIAVSGMYGSGKSSIIKSFFNKRWNKVKYKPIFVSLGMFGRTIDLEKTNNFSQQIEKSIIQQIIYKERADNLPDSNISRIRKLRAKDYIKAFFIFVAIYLVVSNMINITTIQDILTKTKDNILLYRNEQDWIKIFLIVLISLIMMYLSVKLIEYVFKGVASLIKNLNIKNVAINLKLTKIELSSNKEESLINKYLDELIYFFSITKYNIVVIEDLDRFFIDKKEDNSINQKILIIFQKLKELNEILNNSNEINRQICFIYAVKDDLFREQEERTKFFDFIIPVIPVLTPYNAFAELEKQTSLRNIELSKDVLFEMSYYIDDYRIMINILNEYMLYKDVLKSENLDNDKLFALIVFKNKEPHEFELLMKNRGNIYNIINEKEVYVSNIQRKYLEKIIDNKKRINNIQNENLKSFKELKMILIGGLHEENNYSFSSNSIKVRDFLKESTSKDFINNNKIAISMYDGRTYSEEQIFRNITKDEFINRANLIEEKYNDKKILLEAENLKLQKEINNISQMKLKDLLKYKENIPKNSTNFELILFRNGYLDENYKDYIFKFSESESKTKIDDIFISNNRNDKSTDFNYELKRPEIVVEMLADPFFKKTNILNFTLIEFLINNNNEKYQTKKNELFNMLINEENVDLIMDFIYRYINRGKKYCNILEILSNRDDQFLLKLLEYYEENSIDKYENIIKVLLYSPQLLKDKNVNTKIERYIEGINSIENWIEWNDNIKDSLIKLNVKFCNLEQEVNNDILDCIYTKNLYSLDIKVMRKIFKYIGINEYEFNTQNLSIIMRSKKFIKMKDYILNNKKEYIEKCFSKTNNLLTRLEDILDVINNWNIDIDEIEKFIENIPNNLDKIDKVINKEYYNLCLKYNKIVASWENVYSYYSSREYKVNDYLIDYILENKDELLEVEVKEENINIEFKNMCEKIIKNEKINKLSYEKFVLKFKKVMGTINIEKDLEWKIPYLVDNNMVKFNTDNFNIISNQYIEGLPKYICANIDKFIENINNFKLDDEIVQRIIVSEEIKSKYKSKIISKIDVDLLNDATLEYIVDNYSKNKIARLNREVKEKIFSSPIEIAIKIKFLNKELNHETSYENINTYLSILGIPYKFISKIELKDKVFSIPKYNDSIEVLDKLQKNGFLFTYKEFTHTITIRNIKNKNNSI